MKLNQTHGQLSSGNNCGDQTQKKILQVISMTGHINESLPLQLNRQRCKFKPPNQSPFSSNCSYGSNNE